MNEKNCSHLFAGVHKQQNVIFQLREQCEQLVELI